MNPNIIAMGTYTILVVSKGRIEVIIVTVVAVVRVRRTVK